MKKKIYVVTSGCYSDYYIDRVFSTKEKAEEYLEWCGNTDVRIETYKVDDICKKDKYYQIYTEIRYLDGQNGYTIEHQKVSKRLGAYNSMFIDEFEYKCSGELSLCLIRSIKADNYNADFHNKRCKKAVYDYLAIIKQKLNEGCSIRDINSMFDKEVTNDSKNN